MGRSAQGSRRECLRHIAQMRRSLGSEADWSTLLGEAARSLGVNPAAPPLPNLSDPAFNMDFYGQMLEYAAPPHASKRNMALGPDIGAKGQAWNRICKHITESVIHPGWIRRDLIDHVAVLCEELFRKIGDCRLPLCVGPAVATQLFPCCTAIADLRVRKDGWAMASSDPVLEGYFEIASRNARVWPWKSTAAEWVGVRLLKTPMGTFLTTHPMTIRRQMSRATSCWPRGPSRPCRMFPPVQIHLTNARRHSPTPWILGGNLPV